MKKGLALGLIAMAFWGLIYVLPLWVPEFSSFEISMGRFISYGFISFIFLLMKGKVNELPMRHWKMAVIFALTSSLIYYYLIILGIRCLGAPFGTALCSLLPVISAIYGNYRQKVFEWSVLLLPLTLMCIGLYSMHHNELAFSKEISKSVFFLGVLSIFTAKFMWVWYSVNNAQFQQVHKEVRPSVWSSFIGVVCLIGGVSSFGFMLAFYPDNCYLPQATSFEILKYILISFINGFAASWLTLFLWNVASRSVPMAILGQLGVFEVLFGLIYIYLFTQTLPGFFEVLGFSLILLGLYFSLKRSGKFELTKRQSWK